MDGSAQGGGAGAEGARLVLIRHCATPMNEARRYQGHEDVALSPAGRSMALAMRAELEGRDVRPETVWVSDLRRAWETAEIVLPGAEQWRDRRLRELDFGAFSGATYDENLAAHGDVFRNWLRDPDAFPPPGGERLVDLQARVVSWAEDLPPEGAVAVLHVGSMKAVLSWALRQPFAEIVSRHLPIGAIIELGRRGGAWQALRGWDEDEPGGRAGNVNPRPGGSAAWPGAERGRGGRGA